MALVFGDNLLVRGRVYASYGIACLCLIATVAGGSVPNLAFVPLQFSLHPALSFYTLLTAQFVHIDAVHLIGNMLFLFAFGRPMESLLGSVRFGSALLGIGPFAFLGSWLASPDSPIPIVGLSGSLSVLLGSYTVVFPRARLRIIPFLRFPWIRAWLFAAIWLALQLADAFSVGEAESGVAYATHLGGFAIGLVAGAAWKELALDTDLLIARVTGEEP